MAGDGGNGKLRGEFVSKIAEIKNMFDGVLEFKDYENFEVQIFNRILKI